MLECLGKEMNASPQWEGFLARPSIRDAKRLGLTTVLEMPIRLNWAEVCSKQYNSN